jgi:hypothetical protein
MSPYFQDTRANQAWAEVTVTDGWGRTGEIPAPPIHYLPMATGHRRDNRTPVWAWALLGVATVIALCVGGTALLASVPQPEKTGPAETFTSMPATGGNKASLVPDPKVGDVVSDGDTQVTVHAVKCGITSVGLKDFGRRAQGQFCRVDLSLTNNGKDPLFFHADSQVQAEDTKGRKFSPDGTAGIYGNKNGAGFLSEINPGNTVRAFVFFDLPRGAKLKEIEVQTDILGSEIEIGAS